MSIYTHVTTGELGRIFITFSSSSEGYSQDPHTIWHIHDSDEFSCSPTRERARTEREQRIYPSHSLFPLFWFTPLCFEVALSEPSRDVINDLSSKASHLHRRISTPATRDHIEFGADIFPSRKFDQRPRIVRPSLLRHAKSQNLWYFYIVTCPLRGRLCGRWR